MFDTPAATTALKTLVIVPGLGLVVWLKHPGFGGGVPVGVGLAAGVCVARGVSVGEGDGSGVSQFGKKVIAAILLTWLRVVGAVGRK
jgi:hypothetical protein